MNLCIHVAFELSIKDVYNQSLRTIRELLLILFDKMLASISLRYCSNSNAKST